MQRADFFVVAKVNLVAHGLAGAHAKNWVAPNSVHVNARNHDFLCHTTDSIDCYFDLSEEHIWGFKLQL